MNPVIENYEHLSSIMGEMRVAAVLGDWDRLAVLERQCSQRVEVMKEQDRTVPLDENTRQRKVALIRKILADDAEIRSHIEPWVAQFQHLMQCARKERCLHEIYSGG